MAGQITRSLFLIGAASLFNAIIVATSLFYPFVRAKPESFNRIYFTARCFRLSKLKFQWNVDSSSFLMPDMPQNDNANSEKFFSGKDCIFDADGKEVEKIDLLLRSYR